MFQQFWDVHALKYGAKNVSAWLWNYLGVFLPLIKVYKKSMGKLVDAHDCSSATEAEQSSLTPCRWGGCEPWCLLLHGNSLPGLKAEALVVGEGKCECHGNTSASLRKCSAVSFGFTPRCVQWVIPQQQLNILFQFWERNLSLKTVTCVFCCFKFPWCSDIQTDSRHLGPGLSYAPVNRALVLDTFWGQHLPRVNSSVLIACPLAKAGFVCFN